MTSSGTAVVTLPTQTQIVITREFDAPRHLVWKAYTTPELIQRWWSGERGEVTKAEVDLRVDGTWRYVMVANGGFEVGFHGEFREIVPNERLVTTEVYDTGPGSESVDESMAPVITTTFTEVDGRTTMTQVTDCPSVEVRDMIVESGMEAGMQESMDALERVAITLA
ncbi:MAG TPA: SRPBCC family protein [Actinomycetota bacterium]|nr:SRPBCC family protein [Actinomycetota bacterium]